MQPCKTYFFEIDKNTFEKVIWHFMAPFYKWGSTAS